MFSSKQAICHIHFKKHLLSTLLGSSAHAEKMVKHSLRCLLLEDALNLKRNNHRRMGSSLHRTFRHRVWGSQCFIWQTEPVQTCCGEAALRVDEGGKHIPAERHLTH